MPVPAADLDQRVDVLLPQRLEAHVPAFEGDGSDVHRRVNRTMEAGGGQCDALTDVVGARRPRNRSDSADSRIDATGGIHRPRRWTPRPSDSRRGG